MISFIFFDPPKAPPPSTSAPRLTGGLTCLSCRAAAAANERGMWNEKLWKANSRKALAACPPLSALQTLSTKDATVPTLVIESAPQESIKKTGATCTFPRRETPRTETHAEN